MFAGPRIITKKKQRAGDIAAGIMVGSTLGRCRIACKISGEGVKLVERQFIIKNLLVRIHLTILMIKWTGPVPWKFVFSFPGSLRSTCQFRWETDGAFITEAPCTLNHCSTN